MDKHRMHEMCRDLAKDMMLEIQLDNDCVNRYEEAKYPEEHVEVIAKALNSFLSDFIEYIVDCSVPLKLDAFYGFNELNDAINNYFDSL